MKLQPQIESANLILHRRSGISVQKHSDRRGLPNLQNKPLRQLTTLRSEPDEERLKTDTDERLKTEESHLLKIKQEIPPQPGHDPQPSHSFLNVFFSLFKRRKRGATSDMELRVSTRSKKSLMSMIIQRKKMKNKNIAMIERLPPSPQRIKELWGIARKRVYYAIKLVERQDNV